MALTEEDRIGLVGWLLTQIAHDEHVARNGANGQSGESRQATTQAATRRRIVRSFEWWLNHGSDALAAVTLGELATMYADRPGYQHHGRALTSLIQSTVGGPDLAPRVARRTQPPGKIIGTN